ncbi:MAG TPA: hypothetical protein VJT75_11110 [Thermoleophilaceae bacterium]|nr:hypothetical protein [Thermoleophilaceae bacterium]
MDGFGESRRVQFAWLEVSLAEVGTGSGTWRRAAYCPPKCAILSVVPKDDARIATVWPALREPLLSFSFGDIKTLAGAAGLATEKLSGLRQRSSGRSTSKAELADAIDGLFNELKPATQDRVVAHMITEILRRNPEHAERLEELLERRGWTLVEDEPVPIRLGLDIVPDSLPDTAQKGLRKALRRYREGDLDGALTSIVGVIDTLTGEIYEHEDIPGHKRTAFQERTIRAHRTRKAAFKASLAGMDVEERTRAWKAQDRAVGGTSEVLGTYRNAYADAHGPRPADEQIVQAALHAAVFLIRSLTD